MGVTQRRTRIYRKWKTSRNRRLLKVTHAKGFTFWGRIVVRVGSWEWFQLSSKKVEKLIEQCLGPLVHHTHTNVRIALAEGLYSAKRWRIFEIFFFAGVSQLIQNCKICLQSCVQDLLRVLLTLSLDPFSKVSVSRHHSIDTEPSLTKVSSSCQSAIDHVKEQLSGKPKACDFALGLQTAIESLVKEQITGLADAIRSSEANTQTSAHLLTVAYV